MMHSSEASGSCWRRAFIIRPVSLNIRSEAAELAVIAKREQTSKLWNNVNWYISKWNPHLPADRVAGLYFTVIHFLNLTLICIYILALRLTVVLIYRESDVEDKDEEPKSEA